MPATGDNRIKMKFTVNIQRRNRRNAPIGQDAPPYAADGLLFVADGLGGSGGFVHKEAAAVFADEDKALKAILSAFPGASADGPVAEYAKEAFVDAFKEGRTGESAYFASRFLALATVYAFEEARIFDPEKIAGASANEDARFAAKLRDYLVEKELALAKAIGIDGAKVPEGMLFLPSTFCVVLYKEDVDDVDVLVLYAGDSRAYVWDADGLKALTVDHNDESRMMNNLIAPLAKPFIEPVRYRLKKPCAVFAATDGIYDSIYTKQPLYLEAVLFEPFAKVYAESAGAKATDEEKFAAAADKIKADYSGDLGSHDDSNTMAMATFGYPGFDDFAKVAAKRIAYLESLHPDWDKYLYVDADMRCEESRINRNMLTRIYGERAEQIERIYLARNGADARVEESAKSTVSEFCAINARKEKYISLREATAAMSAKYFDDCERKALPAGIKTFGQISARSDEKAVRDFWFRNGARLVCESVAGVGEGKALNVNVSDILLPAAERHIKEVYGGAYLVRKELSAIMDGYDEQYYSLVGGQISR